MADPNAHALFLKDILGKAKEGDKEVTTKKWNAHSSLHQQPLTAEQIANVGRILHQIGNYRDYQRDHNRTVAGATDINGRQNYSNEPVYYQAHDSTVMMAAGIPYPVSDIDHTCNYCTRLKYCDRHLNLEPAKTDISLCDGNHVRMAVTWDLSDPENRKGTWRFSIVEYFDNFVNSDLERQEHEEAQKHEFKEKKRKSKEGSKEKKGCCPVEPRWKIKPLAQRIIEDYNAIQKEEARRANLDRKGREYTVKPTQWGGKDPFTPAETSETRSAYEYRSTGACRIERELRVLLQTWYRGKVGKDQRGRDRTTLNAKEAWRNKMEAQKLAEELRSRKVSEQSTRISVLESQATKPKAERRIVDRLQSRKERAAEASSLQKKGSVEEVMAGRSTKSSKKDAKSSEKSTKPIKKLQQGRPIVEESDETDEDEINEEPALHFQAQSPVLEANDYSGEDEVNRISSSSRLATTFNEHTAEEMGKFQELADEVNETGRCEPAVPSGIKQSAVVNRPTRPQTRALLVKKTANERALLQAIRDKQAEDVASEEEEDAPTDVEKHEDEDPEPTASQKLAKTISENFVEHEKKSKKQNTRAPVSSPSPSPSPSPEPNTSKRKAFQLPKDVELVQKKSRKSYQSTDLIDDSDDEAGYSCRVAPTPRVPEQHEGREFTESLSAEVEESVKVAQIVDVHETEAEAQIVVEKGTTIVLQVASGEGDEDDSPSEVGGSAAIQVDDDSSSNIAEVAGDDSPSEVGMTASTPAEDNDTSSSTDSLFDDTTPPPTSPKRKMPFDDASDSDETDRPVKKAKKVSFSDDTISPEARPRKTSLLYISEDSEGEDGEVNQDDGSDTSEKRESNEAVDYLFEE
jgi:hypothetical protein